MRFARSLALVALSVLLQGVLFAGEVTTRPLRLTQGGTPEKPAIYDGKGITIDLGKDVTDHDWKKEGDVWTSSSAISGEKPVAPGQHTAMFLDETPITLARDRDAERKLTDKNAYRFLPPQSLKPGQMGFTEDHRLYFRWPASKSPGKARIIVLPKPGLSGVTIACSYITVKNITVKYASNDGFNIHDNWVGIRLENVKAFSNADEGISAHETVQMDVDGAEIAWNGSSEGGVADVGQSVTTYTNCTVHDNVGHAFKLVGKSHRVTNTVIYNQSRDFLLGKDTQFKQDHVEWKK